MELCLSFLNETLTR